MKRIIQCVNACKGIWYPENHIPESKAYADRVEALRKMAVAQMNYRISELQEGRG